MQNEADFLRFSVFPFQAEVVTGYLNLLLSVFFYVAKGLTMS